MRQIFAIVRNELHLWAQKPGSWLIVFVVPLLSIWITYSVFGGTGTPVVTIFAVSEDTGQGAAQVMDALRDAENLNLEMVQDRREADERVGAGERMAAVVIPRGFSEAMRTPEGAQIEILVDPARGEYANIVIGLVNEALAPVMIDAEVTRGVESGVGQFLQAAESDEDEVERETGSSDSSEVEDETGSPDFSEDESETGSPDSSEDESETASPDSSENERETTGPDFSDETLQKFLTAAIKGVVSSQVQDALDDPLISLDVQPARELEHVRRPSLIDSLVPGNSLMFVYFLVPSLALAVIAERETGSLRRLLIAPIPRSSLLLGKLIPYALIGIAQMTFILLISQLLFRLEIRWSVESFLALGLLITASALAMGALGIFIAAVARTEGQANGLAIVIILVMAVASGAMFPAVSLPVIKFITPHYWALQGFANVIARGQGFEGVLGPTGILLTIAALLFTAGAVLFSIQWPAQPHPGANGRSVSGKSSEAGG
ncbi:MAG: ABC transporter permease [Chloroflexi bacterium]|nr:ABC transporter permease [Chloroflexota bacterium]